MSGYMIIIKETGEFIGYSETNRSAIQTVRYDTFRTGLKEEDYDVIPLI